VVTWASRVEQSASDRTRDTSGVRHRSTVTGESFPATAASPEPPPRETLRLCWAVRGASNASAFLQLSCPGFCEEEEIDLVTGGAAIDVDGRPQPRMISARISSGSAPGRPASCHVRRRLSAASVSHVKFRAVVRRFLSDANVMWMALSHASRRDADELRLRSQLFNVPRATIPHPGS